MPLWSDPEAPRGRPAYPADRWQRDEDPPRSRAARETAALGSDDPPASWAADAAEGDHVRPYEFLGDGTDTRSDGESADSDASTAASVSCQVDPAPPQPAGRSQAGDRPGPA
eukprot:EG_transcript_53884